MAGHQNRTGGARDILYGQACNIGLNPHGHKSDSFP
jgi:hypothetical protein